MSTHQGIQQIALFFTRFQTFPKAIYREGVFLEFWKWNLPSESKFGYQNISSERNPLAMKKGNDDLKGEII